MEKNKVKVSICLIAKNEERCIERCLKSFLPVASELIVVDTGSTDRTVEIASSLGAKVYHFEWINDFSAAKNYALSKASGDWIIFPDADDYLPGECADALLAAIESKRGDENAYAFSHTIRNFLGAGTEDSRYIDTIYCKIFRSDPRIRYQRPLHEYIGWIGDDPPPFKMLKASPETFLFYHDGYRDDLVVYKDERDLEVMDGVPRRVLPEMARFYWYLGRANEARYAFGRYFDSDEADDKHTVEPHIFDIELLFSLKRPFSEIDFVLDHGLENYPEHPGMRLLAGYANYRCKRYPEAIMRFREGFDLLDSGRAAYSPETLLAGSHARFWCMLAELYALKGENTSALYSAKRALQLDPEHTGALNLLVRTDPKAALVFVSEQYDLSKLDVLKKLIPAFAANRPGVGFLTLFEKYFGQTGQQDIHFVTMQAVAGEYASAVNALLWRYEASKYEPYLAKALAFAVLSQNSEPLEAVAKRGVYTPYARLAKMTLGNENAAEESDLSGFIRTTHFMLGLSGVTPPLEDFASLAAYRFDQRALAQLALLLEKHGCYQDVLDIVDDALGDANDSRMLAALVEAGALSAYRTGEYERAERYLQVAQAFIDLDLELNEQSGCSHPYRLGSYAAFVAEKLLDGAKKRLEALSEALFALDWDCDERPPRLLLLDEEEAPRGETLVKNAAVSPQGF